MFLLNDAVTIDFQVSGFCTDAANILQFVGWILLIFKIAIPILIVVLGLFDFGKAVVSSKDDEIKNQSKRLMYRVLAGVIIFFIPTIVMFIFGTINEYSTQSENFETCETCILRPWNC